MNSYATNLSKQLLFTQEKPHTEEPTAKTAVLFTDIVGSTEFFKSYGDKQGRQMLKEHYDIASSVISRFSGHVLKFIGDSIMASFEDPSDALRAAIFLQKKIHIYNKRVGLMKSTHIRVGIHYGEVILGKGDIYGDVVNVASKLTNIAKGDEIYISSEVYEHIKGIDSISFESPTGIDRKSIPEDLVIFRVNWGEVFELDPEKATIILIHPIIEIADMKALSLWNEFITTEPKAFKDKIKKKKNLHDQTMLLYPSDPLHTLDIARNIIDMLSERQNQKMDTDLLPLQIAIDTGYNIPDECLPAWFRDCLSDISPGYIYISEDAYFNLEGLEGASPQKLPSLKGSKRFYRILYPLKKGDSLIREFPYGHALVAGPNRPCFYCGSKKHRVIDCPSKNLPDYTHSAEKIGYYTIEKINSHFLKTILNSKDILKQDDPDFNNQLNITNEVFFELTRVYQLRFFRAIWNIDSTNWLMIRGQKSSADGGIIWLAQDSIRISDLDKAESLLKKAEEDRYDNFRLYCAYGYLYLEKEDINYAEHYFKKALSYAKNSGHKTFINLLLARLYFLDGRLDKASKIINEIILDDPFCVDAIYMDIIIKFRQGKESKALQQLINLIENNRAFFVYAYIDYELFKYRHIIAEALDRLFKKAKADAEGLYKVAEEEFNGLKDILDNQTVSDIQALFLKIKNAFDEEGYFGYLDAKDLSDSIILRCRGLLMERRKRIKTKVHEFYNRIGKGILFLNEYKYKRFSSSSKGQLEAISAKVNRISEGIDYTSSAEIKGMESTCNDIDQELNNLEEKIENLIYLRRCFQALSIFIKWGLSSISAVMLVCFILLPLFAYYIDTLSQEFGVINQTDIWLYQKTIFIWGSIISVFLSFFVSIKRFLKEN
ncbi:MAG: hypothetical protein N3D15_08505 [Syntrophorhabdaceae bacterium]|nr:hypothetical protein [Syntrophorhabdaceae bacterium]